MKTSTIGFALLSLAGFSSAAPRSGRISARQTCNGINDVTFIGAGTGPDDPNPPQFVQNFPQDGSLQNITNPLVVTTIYVGCYGICHFFGLEGSVTEGGGRDPDFVQPPQTQVSGYCVPDS